MSITIDCDGKTIREINSQLRELASNGEAEVLLKNPGARHNLAVAMPEGLTLTVDGPAGYYPGGLNDGATIHIRGSVGWGAAESMRDGTVVIDGDAGNAVAASIRAGTVVVKGSVSTRAGIAMKGGLLLIGGDAGQSAGFMMQKGLMVICGDAAEGVADSMYAGTVLVGGKVHGTGADVVDAEITPEERRILDEALARFEIPAPRAFRKLVSGKKLWNFHKADLALWKEAL